MLSSFINVVPLSVVRRAALVLAVLAVTPAAFAQSPTSPPLPPTNGYRLQNLGLTKSSYETATVTYNNTALTAYVSPTFVLGTSSRRNSTYALGTEPWIFNGTTNILLGLTGGRYEAANEYYGGAIVRSSAIVAFNPSGIVVGTTSGQNSLGSTGSGVWLYAGGSVVTELPGLLGEVYSPPDGQRTTTVRTASANGLVGGGSNRYAGDGSGRGSDSWIYNGAATIPVGYRGSDYEATFTDSYPESSYRSSNVEAITPNGTVLGSSLRVTFYQSSLLSRGSDLWAFKDGGYTAVGLQGADYEYPLTEGGTTYRLNQWTTINASGLGLGTSRRIKGNFDNGQDLWAYSDGVTRQIGLTGPGYEAVSGTGNLIRFSESQALTQSGFASGYSSRVSQAATYIGQDAWVYNHATGITARVGLSGADYEYVSAVPGGGTARSSTVLYLAETGTAIGTSGRFKSGGQSLGTDAWYFNGSMTRQIGLTGPDYQRVDTSTPGGGLLQFTAVNSMVGDTMASGTTRRYAINGQFAGEDAWFFDGISSTRIGLIGPGYERLESTSDIYPLRHSAPFLANVAGYVAGSSSTLIVNCNDSWLYHNGVTQRINLTGPGTVSYTGRHNSQITGMNIAGQTIGYSDRYSPDGIYSLGQTGWFYDPATDATTPLDFDSSGPEDNGNTVPYLITDSGVVLGSYKLADDGINRVDHIFWWSAAAGFRDLGAIIDGGLTESGWSRLAQTLEASGVASDGGGPEFILGKGYLSGVNTGPSLFLATAVVPEPTAFAGIAPVGCLFLYRRRVKLERKAMPR